MKNTQTLSIAKLTILVIFGLFILLISVFTVSILTVKHIKPDDLMPVDNSKTLIIDNINIVSVTDNKLLTNRQLIIEKGLIKAIRPAGFEQHEFYDPNNIQRINAKGAYVIPGLFDMHVHLHDRKYLMLNLAYGVTSVRSLRGQPMQLRWKQELNDNEWLGSNLYLSSPVLAKADSHALDKRTLSVEDGKKQVRNAKQKGYDLIKVYGYLEADIFEAIVTEAKKVNMPVAKHAPHPPKNSSWRYLKGLQSLEHVEDIYQGPLNYQFNKEQLQTIAMQIKELNVPVVPTLATFDHLTQLSNGKQTFIDTLELDYINPLYLDILGKFSVTRWLNDNAEQSLFHLKKQQFLFEIVQVLHQNKVKLLVGSDSGTMFTVQGIATHNEMTLLKESGLSNSDILKAATINAAQTLRVENEYGSVEVGKVADLVLVTSNPLDDLRVLKQPYAVVKKGQWLNENKLRQLQQRAKNTASYYWSLVRLAEDYLSRLLS